eukprot:Opistho-2@84922
MLGRVPDGAVAEAFSALADIATCAAELTEAESTTDVARIKAARDRMDPVLNRFFELIPHGVQSQMSIADVNDKIRLLVEISDMQVAARLHLGAQLRQTTMNPMEVFRDDVRGQ